MKKIFVWVLILSSQLITMAAVGIFFTTEWSFPELWIKIPAFIIGAFVIFPGLDNIRNYFYKTFDL